ncbi:MAG: vinorine synthase [bacterium]|nr:vinorine synthase [bacterium]
MESKQILVKANNPKQQVISCTIVDQILKTLSAPVVFFYKKSIDYDIIITSLRKVLDDFPLVEARLKVKDHELYINCKNQGIPFTVSEIDYTLDQLFENLLNIKHELLVDMILGKEAIQKESPLVTMKLNYLKCGGMTLGICWHHTIGDTGTFVNFFKALSNTVNGKGYEPPLIAENRDEYLKKNIKDNNNAAPSVRYLEIMDIIKILIYMLFKAWRKKTLYFYFSPNELKNMKNDLLSRSSLRLSTGDILSTHLFSLIKKEDRIKKKSNLSITVNYRPRVNLPQTLLGNHLASIIIPIEPGTGHLELAETFRKALNNYESQYMNYHTTAKYVNENGGAKKINRFLQRAIDPINRGLLITNWSKSGIYDVTFGDAKPFFFMPIGKVPFPWLSSLIEGFARSGLLYSVVLPSDIAKRLIKKENLQLIHKFRDDKDPLPDEVNKLKWIY